MQKVYLITGANSDVGIAYLRKLEQSTSDEIIVLAHYHQNKSKLEELKNEVKHMEIRMLQADLSSEEAVKHLIEDIKGTGLQVTHMLHIAASKLDYMKIKQWDSEKVRKEMQIQFFSFAEICKEVLPAMAKNKYGRVAVVLTAALLGRPPKFMSSYVAVKGALQSYIKAAAAEYGDKGIRINGVAPNMMETDFLKNIDERIAQMTAENSALKRNITVDETAEGIQMLLSDAVSYMNGSILNYSGGDYM